jgi:putative endonuclease
VLGNGNGSLASSGVFHSQGIASPACSDDVGTLARNDGQEVVHSIASNHNTMKGGFVYIITNAHHTVLYIGVTSNLFNRTIQHRDKLFPKSFSARYNLSKLVYYEIFDSIIDAIAREKQLKAGSRKKKEALINKLNPEWKDLFEVLVNEGWDT